MFNTPPPCFLFFYYRRHCLSREPRPVYAFSSPPTCFASAGKTNCRPGRFKKYPPPPTANRCTHRDVRFFADFLLVRILTSSCQRVHSPNSVCPRLDFSYCRSTPFGCHAVVKFLFFPVAVCAFNVSAFSAVALSPKQITRLIMPSMRPEF